ncbi:hypothetical protein JX265_006231 [Neoarthrinium moseri]|uniref:Uncharacterized protein n=1 Tax=Neoarthrinium moseri TaxID=1658444 RepID=A0A9P9WLY3_9PEZI|nr:hypothetical protein JX265_006231 [Neoarthrinium moseri]
MAADDQPAVQLAQPLFEDFDDRVVFDATRQWAAAESCQNFVLEFGPKRARIARDLDTARFQDLLDHHDYERDTEHPIRWINIWDTSKQRDIVELLGQRYRLSPRLISLMKYATDMKDKAAQLGKEKKTANASPKVVSIKQSDAEKAFMQTDQSSGSTQPGRGPPVQRAVPLDGEEIELYLLLKDTVNYSSLDHTEKALCIGAHWLHKRPAKPEEQPEANKKHLPLKPGQQNEATKKFMPPQHWLWLTLCDDHTVITFHENPTIEPLPSKGWNIDEWRSAQIKSMRENSLNVLIQQSKHGIDLFKHRPLSQSSIREVLKQAQDRKDSGRPVELSRVHSDMPLLESDPGTTIEAEGTSRLFFYLFEDYAAAEPLRDAKMIMEEMTPKVLHSADRQSRVKSRDIIPRLHILSKDLRTLRHLFENYKTVITKVMMAAKHKRPDAPPYDARASLILRSGTDLSETPRGSSSVYLTDSVMQRFDRLRDQLQGVMLNTIEGHLEEISALTQTYFNLTQQKDSAATARLTRSATLLAKLSVFFLPISFVTSYFSVQIEDLYIYWHKETYWYTFAVVITISFLCLSFFGRLLMFFSDVMDDWSAVISMWFRRALKPLGCSTDDDEDE